VTPICPSLGADAVMTSGRSARLEDRAMVGERVASRVVVETVTRSDTAAGESPASGFPKLMFSRTWLNKAS
jgi:hypothetical protein